MAVAEEDEENVLKFMRLALAEVGTACLLVLFILQNFLSISLHRRHLGRTCKVDTDIEYPCAGEAGTCKAGSSCWVGIYAH